MCRLDTFVWLKCVFELAVGMLHYGVIFRFFIIVFFSSET